MVLLKFTTWFYICHLRQVKWERGMHLGSDGAYIPVMVPREPGNPFPGRLHWHLPAADALNPPWRYHFFELRYFYCWSKNVSGNTHIANPITHLYLSMHALSAPSQQSSWLRFGAGHPCSKRVKGGWGLTNRHTNTLHLLELWRWQETFRVVLIQHSVLTKLRTTE